MHRTVSSLVACVALLLFPAAGGRASLLISEMCDPHLHYTTDRFIEIYNPGEQPVDLSGWSLVAVGNYGDIFTWELSGQIEPLAALVAGDASTVTSFPVHFPKESWSESNGLWNGKIGDGAKLLAPGSVLVDYAVVSGTHFENKDYIRKYGVTEPDTTYTPSEWTAIPVELATDGSPGSHETEPPITGPEISNIETHPEFPMAGEPVEVSAEITDTFDIVSVTLSWGTSPATLPNDIAMLPWYGYLYLTATPIPVQPEGVTIYFRITATNEQTGTTVSDLQTYSLPIDLTIHEIQGESASSPYDGQTVLTAGVITSACDSHFVLQDGAGAWNGIWVDATVPASVGDSLQVRARVTESHGSGDEGNTMLTEPIVMGRVPGVPLPPAVLVPTDEIATEALEGVLVALSGALCTDPALGYGECEVDDGSGEGRIGDLAYDYVPTLGTAYDITGPVAFSYGRFKLEPRGATDVVWAGDAFAPVVVHASVTSDTTLIVAFSEAVEEVTAGTPGHYVIDQLDVRSAFRDGIDPALVHLTFSPMGEGDYTIIVNGVKDLYGNVATGTWGTFTFRDSDPPAGYYAGTAGLTGDALKAALHEIINDHTAHSYDYAWTAFRSTDPKPNGKVWDIYSDVPGGPSPYEYNFGVDQGGIGGQEGEGYTREHAWPRSWFGDGAPMESDLFALYPCDAHVNGNRGAHPYGEVANPEWISLNGSRRGLCSYPGYSLTAFEPIDEYKGDLARSYFYMSTRYYSEDGGWPGSPMTDGAELRSWAAAMLLAWHAQDPVSWKELARNGEIFELQHNRNPYVDHPEFAYFVFGSLATAPEASLTSRPTLTLASPIPASNEVKFRLEVPTTTNVHLAIYDVGGRKIALLASGSHASGLWTFTWEGADAQGRCRNSGVYLARMRAGDFQTTRRVVLLH